MTIAKMSLSIARKFPFSPCLQILENIGFGAPKVRVGLGSFFKILNTMWSEKVSNDLAIWSFYSRGNLARKDTVYLPTPHSTFVLSEVGFEPTRTFVHWNLSPTP